MTRWWWIGFLARTFPRSVLVIGGLISVAVAVACAVAVVNQGISFQWDYSAGFDIPSGRRGAGEPQFNRLSFGQLFGAGLVIVLIALTVGVTSIIASVRLSPRSEWRGRHSA